MDEGSITIKFEFNEKNDAIDEETIMIISIIVFVAFLIAEFTLFILVGNSTLKVLESCKALRNDDKLDKWINVTKAGLYGFIICHITLFISIIYLGITQNNGIFCPIAHFIKSLSGLLISIFIPIIFIGQCKAVNVVKNCPINTDNNDKSEIDKFMSDSNTVNRLFGISIFFLGILATIIGVSLIIVILALFVKLFIKSKK